jgi:hypothetical protein
MIIIIIITNNIALNNKEAVRIPTDATDEEQNPETADITRMFIV